MIKGIIGDILGSIHEGYQWVSRDNDPMELNVERIKLNDRSFPS